MGFLDTVTSAFNKGTASAKRTGRLAQLRLQANDLLRQRRDLTAQLGASLYETVKEIPELRESREPLFASIEDIDQKRARIDEEIAEIEAQIEAQRASSMTFKCPSCGADVSSGDMFCSTCGISIEEVKAAYAAPEPADSLTCSVCGATLSEGDRFCMVCGAKQELIEEVEQAAEAVASEEQ
ncbi:MAG: zinc-ribbon domain-containing protein [Eggerthellaceae bacterium]|nr:zinc-ribbon domain-containing protein [Eggerthellaceae bacterium]